MFEILRKFSTETYSSKIKIFWNIFSVSPWVLGVYVSINMCILLPFLPKPVPCVIMWYHDLHNKRYWKTAESEFVFLKDFFFLNVVPFVETSFLITLWSMFHNTFFIQLHSWQWGYIMLDCNWRNLAWNMTYLVTNYPRVGVINVCSKNDLLMTSWRDYNATNGLD